MQTQPQGHRVGEGVGTAGGADVDAGLECGDEDAEGLLSEVPDLGVTDRRGLDGAGRRPQTAKHQPVALWTADSEVQIGRTYSTQPGLG